MSRSLQEPFGEADVTRLALHVLKQNAPELFDAAVIKRHPRERK